MARASYDPVIRIGDTWRSPRWALVIAGEPVDLTDGWTVKAQARAYSTAQTPLYTWDLDDGIELGTAPLTVDGQEVTGSTVRLRLTAAQTAAMDVWAGDWDLEVSHPTFDNGDLYRKTIVTGRAKTVQDTTR